MASYVWLFLVFGVFTLSCAALALYLFPSSAAVWGAVLSYSAWMYADWDVGENGGRKSRWGIPTGILYSKKVG